jgi:hypothetical protein
VIVVSDTSVITALLQISQIELLPRLYTKVILPESVHEELRRSHADLPSFLIVQKAQNRSDVAVLEKLLDKGKGKAKPSSFPLRSMPMPCLWMKPKAGKSPDPKVCVSSGCWVSWCRPDEAEKLDLWPRY